MQIYALFGAKKWTNMRYVHLKAAPRPHQQSLPDNLLLIFTISNVHNVHNIQYLHNIQCACFKEWRRECIRVCTLSKCCHFLLCEYFSSVVLILIHQSLSIFKALAGLASLCDVCYARCLIGIRGCSGHHQHLVGKSVRNSRVRNLEQKIALELLSNTSSVAKLLC